MLTATAKCDVTQCNILQSTRQHTAKHCNTLTPTSFSLEVFLKHQSLHTPLPICYPPSLPVAPFPTDNKSLHKRSIIEICIDFYVVICVKLRRALQSRCACGQFVLIRIRASSCCSRQNYKTHKQHNYTQKDRSKDVGL